MFPWNILILQILNISTTQSHPEFNSRFHRANISLVQPLFYRCILSIKTYVSFEIETLHKTFHKLNKSELGLSILISIPIHLVIANVYVFLRHIWGPLLSHEMYLRYFYLKLIFDQSPLFFFLKKNENSIVKLENRCTARNR